MSCLHLLSNCIGNSVFTKYSDTLSINRKSTQENVLSSWSVIEHAEVLITILP